MAKIKAFRGWRPVPEKVSQVASRPYDVLNSAEAREAAEGNPWSFLRVVKPEIDLPEGTDYYATEVYEKGRDNFQQLVRDGIFFQDASDCLYVYAQEMHGQKQYGIVAAASVEDYLRDVIKKHELTRPVKEEDRKNHVRISNINAEPVFFAYPAVKRLDEIVDRIVQATPDYDFTTDDGIGHSFWVVSDASTIAEIVTEFDKIPATYVADGHHRTAAAALVGEELRLANSGHTGDEPYNFFLAVHFPDDQLRIIDYNRVVRDLNGMSTAAFLKALEADFIVENKGTAIFKPSELHTFGLYLDHQWYSLSAKAGTYDDNDPIGVLDVSILSRSILEPLLGIKDLRRDSRIDFVGGIRGLEELESRVNSGEMKAAFALYPVSMQQLIDIADSGSIMPPKTTWFEPKLRSGLVVYSLE